MIDRSISDCGDGQTWGDVFLYVGYCALLGLSPYFLFHRERFDWNKFREERFLSCDF